MTKKILSILMVCALAVCMCIPAFAAESSSTTNRSNHQDKTEQFVFNIENGQTDYTTWRKKDDNTPVYVKAVENTLPLGGFTIQSYYKTSLNQIRPASTGQYRINDYKAHTIISDNARSWGDLDLTDKQVRLCGRYQNMQYTYGDVTIKWSPDTMGQYPSLN